MFIRFWRLAQGSQWQNIIKEALHDPVDGTERQAEVIKEAGQVLQATLQDCASLTSWGKPATSPQAFAPRRNLPAVLPTRAARISATSKRVSSQPTALSARKPEMRSRKTQEARACRHARANFLYLMRFGSAASSPRRRFLSSS